MASELEKLRKSLSADSKKRAKQTFQSQQRTISSTGSAGNTPIDKNKLGQNLERQKRKEERLENVRDFLEEFGKKRETTAPTTSRYANRYGSSVKPPGEEDNLAQWAGKQAMRGLSTFNEGLAQGIDWVLPTEVLFGESNRFDRFLDSYTTDREMFEQRAKTSSDSKGGKGWGLAGNLLAGTVQTLPNLAFAGVGAAGQGASLASQAAASSGGILNTIRTTAASLSKNPAFWNSFLQSTGMDYAESKALGQDGIKATVSAFTTGLINAAIEMGGGLETLPAALKSGNKSLIRTWIGNALDEGKEEVVQGIISGLVDKIQMGEGMLEGQNVFDPRRMATEFGMGAAVGGILGGATTGLSAMADYGARADLGSRIRRESPYYADEVVERGLASDTDSAFYAEATKALERLNKGKTLSDAQLGGLYREERRNANREFNYDTAGYLNELISEHNGSTKESDISRVVELYGDSGKKALSNNYRPEDDFLTYSSGFFDYYKAGTMGTDVDKVESEYDVMPHVKEAAYMAGKNDTLAAKTEQTERAEFTTINGNKPGFADTDASQGISRGLKKTLNLMGQAADAKIMFEGQVEEGKANGRLSGDVISIARDSENPYFVVAVHEGTHRLKITSPKEYNAFKSYALDLAAKMSGKTVDEVIAQKIKQYAEGGVDLTPEGAEDEVVAEFAESLFTNEQELRAFVAKADRTVVQKIFDAIRDFLDKLKSLRKKNNLDAETLEQLGLAISEVEKAKQLWGKALEATQSKKGQASKKSQSEQQYSLKSPAPTFYSKMEREIEATKQTKLGAKSVIPMLKGKGVKDEEIKWSGIEEFLEGKKSVSKDELLEFARGNQLQIETKTFNKPDASTEAIGEFADVWNRILGEYMDENEVVESLEYDPEAVWNRILEEYEDENIDEEQRGRLEEALRAAIDEVEQGGATVDKTKWSEYRLDGGTNYRELIFKMPGSNYTNNAMSTHWTVDETGVLAHARVQDFDVDGGKMLFIEEIQSDWHNEGQKRGYSRKGVEEDILKAESELRKIQKQLDNKRFVFSDKAETQLEDRVENPEQIAMNLAHTIKTVEEVGFLLKFYGLAKDLEPELREIVELQNKESEVRRRLNELKDSRSSNVPDAPFRDNYHEYVLKSLLRDAAENGYDSIGWTTGEIQEQRWSSEYAEGYRIEYDQDIPKFLRKYGKKWGATVGKTSTAKAVIRNGRTYNFGEEIWKMDITDSMRESVMYEGQPMYSLKKDSEGNALSEEQAEYFKDSKIRDANGNLKVMYHGTMNEFTVFDTSVEGGKNGTAEGFGLYFADTQEVTKAYGNRQLMGYVNITNPARSDKKTIKQTNLVKLVKALCEAEAKQMVADEEYDNINDALKDTWVSNYVFTYDMSMSQAYKQVAQDIIRMCESDMEIVQEVMSGNAIRSYAQAYEFYETLKATTGIDGYITEWTGDSLPDGKAQIVIAFDSNQFKNVDNKKPTKNEDIRLSLKGTSNLLKENAKLREYNDYLKNEFKLTKGIKPDKKAMTSLTKAILKDYQSNVEQDVIQPQLDALYDYIANDPAAEWETAKEKALGIANDMLRDATAVDSELQQEFKDFKEYLKDYRISISDEAKGDFKGEWNEFRKRNFGWLTITNDGENIDKVYQGLADMFPQHFDENITNEADQLMEVEKVYNQLKNIEYNPYSNEMEAAAEYLANDIIDRFYDVPKAKPTYADKKQAQIDKIRRESKQKVREAVRKERERGKKKADAYKAKRDESQKKMSDRRQRKILREKILRHIKPMQKKLLSPTDKQHVPEELRTSVAAVLAQIDASSNRLNRFGEETKRTEAFKRAKEQLLAIQGDTTLDPSLFGNTEEGIESNFDAVKDMADIKLADMTLEQLDTVWKVVVAMETAINNYNKALAQSKFATIIEYADAFDVASKARKDKKGKFKKYGLDLETPYTFFSHFGDPGMDFYRMLRDAQDYEQTIIDELAEKVSAVVSKEQRKQFEKKIHAFETENGDTINLTTAHIMELYVAVRREQFAGHLYRGGMVQPEINRKIRRGTDAVKITEADTTKMFKALTQEEKDIADAMQKITLFLADKGNEASMKAYGYKKFTDPNYWTIKSAKEGLTQTVEKGQNQARSIANMGSAKAVVPNASNPLELGGMFNTFDQHASDMVTYSAWLLPMEDANRLFNFKFKDENGVLTGRTLQGIINRVAGEKADQYWLNLMRDIQNGIGNPSDDSMSGLINKAINNVKKASVATNIRVVVQQPIAYLRALAVLSPMNLEIATSAILSTKGSGWQKALKYAPIAARKAAGGFDVAMSPTQLSETLYTANTKKGKAVQLAKDLPTLATAKADEFTWGLIWNACEYNIGRTQKDLKKGSEEFYEAVAAKFADVIDQTQVVDGVLQRSQIMRSSKDLNRQATSFMGEAIMSLNVLMRAMDDVRYQTGKARSEGFKKLGRSVMALLVSNVAVALAQSLVDAARDDETEEKWLKRVLAAFTGITGDEETWAEFAASIILDGNVYNSNNMLTWIPYVKDIHSMLQGYTVERMDAAALSDLLYAAENSIKSLSGEGKWTQGYAIGKVAVTGAKLLGSSAGNLLRDVESVLRSVLVETDNYARLYDLEKAIYDVKNNAKYFYNIAYKALKAGDTEAYNYIVADMIDNGIEPSKIQSSMKTKAKADPDFGENLDGFDATSVAAGIKFTTSEEEREEAEFDMDSLTGEQYTEYNEYIGENYQAVYNEMKDLGLYEFGENEQNDIIADAYNYVASQALREVAGSSYTETRSWVLNADEAVEMGISPARYFVIRKKFNTTDAKVNGDTVRGLKKQRMYEYLSNIPNLTTAEYNYFWKEVFGYK